MRTMLPVLIVPCMLVFVLVPGWVMGAASSHSSTEINNVRSARRPGPSSMDFKKQDPAQTIPTIAKARLIPNLDPLINQLIRYADLNSSAIKIMPWVYTSTTESVVADFEDALSNLDLADECLQEAMRKVLYEDNVLEMDPTLKLAMLQLDDAEFTILLLVEIAKLEL